MKDIFQNSALVLDVHLCSVHLVTRLGPVWHTFTTSCFCFVNRSTFPKELFFTTSLWPLLSCKLQRLLFCGIFTAPVRVWVFLKHEDASLIWPKCIFKAPLRKRNPICMKISFFLSVYEFGVYWRCIAELNYGSNWETFQISLRLLNIYQLNTTQNIKSSLKISKKNHIHVQQIIQRL